MDAIQFRRASAFAGAIFALAFVGEGVLRPATSRGPLAAEELRDAPVVWEAADRGDIRRPKERDPNLRRDGVDESFFHPLGRLLNPARLARKVGTIFGADHASAAPNVNSLDEVPSSSWFTNRIGLYPMTPEEVARGARTADGPDRSSPWTLISAKTEGVTPGFNIRDGRGDVYLIKFDPPCCPGMSSAAGVISGLLLHAAGYSVPEDFVVTFRREDLILGERVQTTDPDGRKRAMTGEDLDRILSPLAKEPDGSWRAIASKFLVGKPAGPFNWRGRRKDDRFDTVRHENRRELRGFRVVAAWLDHFDTKQHNTLDMYVEDGGRRYLRHHLIDFASTLGAGASRPFPKANYEYFLDTPATLGRALSLGFYQSPWERIERPEGLTEVGYLESEEFEPGKWKPLNPNPAFANVTDRDGYWGAKIVTAFTDAQLEAAVAEGRYRNPDAARYVARLLKERRDKTARHWFDRIPPLDFFTLDGEVLDFHDLGAERGIYPGKTARYRARVRPVDSRRGGGSWSEWVELDRPSVDLSGGALGEWTRTSADTRPFLAVQTQVERGEGWSSSVTVYIARTGGRIVALDR